MSMTWHNFFTNTLFMGARKSEENQVLEWIRIARITIEKCNKTREYEKSIKLHRNTENCMEKLSGNPKYFRFASKYV